MWAWQSGMCCALQVRRPGGAGKGVSPALAALVEPGAPGRHLPLGASPEAEAKDPDLAALLKKARAVGLKQYTLIVRVYWGVRHLPLDARPEAEAKDPDLAALLKKARAGFH